VQTFRGLQFTTRFGDNRGHNNDYNGIKPIVDEVVCHISLYNSTQARVIQILENMQLIIFLPLASASTGTTPRSILEC